MEKVSRHPGSLQRTYDILYAVIGIACVLSLAVAWSGTGSVMNGFPVLFFLAAILNGLAASLRFRRDQRGKNRMSQGLFFLLVTLVLLVLSYVSAVCIWSF